MLESSLNKLFLSLLFELVCPYTKFLGNEEIHRSISKPSQSLIISIYYENHNTGIHSSYMREARDQSALSPFTYILEHDALTASFSHGSHSPLPLPLSFIQANKDSHSPSAHFPFNLEVVSSSRGSFRIPGQLPTAFAQRAPSTSRAATSNAAAPFGISTAFFTFF